MPTGLTLPMDFGISKQTQHLKDDFHGAAIGGWTALGTAAAQDEHGGVLKYTSGTTANNEAGPHRTKLEFLPGPTSPLYFYARPKFVDASGTTGAVAVGITSELGTGLIADGGLSVKSGDQTSFLFVKLTGESNWRCFSKVGAQTALNDILLTTNANNLSFAAQAPGAYQDLEIKITSDSNFGLATYLIDGREVCKHRFQWTGVEIAGLAVFCKTTNTTAQAIFVDVVEAAQKR